MLQSWVKLHCNWCNCIVNYSYTVIVIESNRTWSNRTGSNCPADAKNRSPYSPHCRFRTNNWRCCMYIIGFGHDISATIKLITEIFQVAVLTNLNDKSATVTASTTESLRLCVSTKWSKLALYFDLLLFVTSTWSWHIDRKHEKRFYTINGSPYISYILLG